MHSDAHDCTHGWSGSSEAIDARHAVAVSVELVTQFVAFSTPSAAVFACSQQWTDGEEGLSHRSISHAPLDHGRGWLSGGLAGIQDYR